MEHPEILNGPFTRFDILLIQTKIYFSNLLQDKIYLLQSRPMTSTKSFTAWELLHEFDSAIMSEEDYFSFGNVGEVMPEALTPLTSSLMIPSFEKGLIRNYPLFEVSPFFHQIMAISHHRLTVNMFGLFLRVVKGEIMIQNRVQALTVYGHEFLTEEVLAIAVHRYGVASNWLVLWNTWHALRNGWIAKSAIESCGRFMEKSIDTYNRPDLQIFQSPKELYGDITQKVENDFTYVQGIHGLSTMMGSIFQIILFAAIGEGRTELSSEYLSDITTLLSSCGNVESADIPNMLEEISSTILKCETQRAQEFCNIHPDVGIKWLTENCIAAYKLFESFIQKHAHRGYHEVMHAPINFNLVLLKILFIWN